MTGNLPEHWIDITRLPKNGDIVRMEADEKQRTRIAGATGVDAISSLVVKIRASHWGKEGAIVAGSASCLVTQSCVVTLDPVENRVSSDFSRKFVPEISRHNGQPEIIDGEMVLDPEDDDYPDVVSGNRINLWEVVVEELNLVIDPYPRSEGAESGDLEEPEHGSKEHAHNPFSELKALITKKKP